MQQALEEAARHWEQLAGGPAALRNEILRLTGPGDKPDVNPVPGAVQAGFDAAGDAVLRRFGWDPSPLPGDRPQQFAVRRIQASLRLMEDPDPDILEQYANGVRIGVGVRLPRARAIFARKTRWKLPEQQEEDAAQWKENYKSAAENPEPLLLQLKKDAAATPPRIILMTRREAEERWGKDLYVGALAVIEEGEDKWRIVHDATHEIFVNHRIRVRDQLTSPMASDLQAQQEEMCADGRSHHALTADVEGAHRTVVVAEPDWGFQTSSPFGRHPPGHPEEMLAVNPCGTFGVGSAAYWWGRLAAMGERWLHYVLGPKYREFLSALFADDLRIVARGPRWVFILIMVLLALQYWGTKFKWKKLGGGVAYDWIGYAEDLVRFQLGISVKRRDWLLRWVSDLLGMGAVLVREMREVVGRLGFACEVLSYERPFLGPVHAWVACVPDQSFLELPVMLALIFTWIAKRLRVRHMMPVRIRRASSGELFRADARATESEVQIGGWLCADGRATQEAPFFSVILTAENAPWAFRDKSPQRRIAALELLGTLICLVRWPPQRPFGEDGVLVLSGGSDNQGNGFLLDKLMTSKFPLCAVLMEVSAQLEARGCQLLLDWVPRERNVPADDLSNGNWEQFSPGLEVPVDLATLPFLVLHDMLAAGELLFDELAAAKLARSSAPQGAKRRRAAFSGSSATKKLRVRDPW
jgi:hypothetical protein